MKLSTSDPCRQNCNAPLSIVLLFSQYCMVNSLIKRLELLFLWVFAWPKASRTQYTCVWHQSKRVMCSEYVLLLSFFNNKNSIDSISRAETKLVLRLFHFPPLDVNMHPLTGHSAFILSWDDQRASWPRYQRHNDDFIVTQHLYFHTIRCMVTYWMTDWLRAELVNLLKHHQVLTYMTDFYSSFCLFIFIYRGEDDTKFWPGCNTSSLSEICKFIFLYKMFFFNCSISWFAGKCAMIDTCWSLILHLLFPASKGW